MRAVFTKKYRGVSVGREYGFDIAEQSDLIARFIPLIYC